MATRRAFLLGHHIAHSLSPAIHNAAFRALGLDAEFGLLDVPRERLDAALARMREADCLGGSVTMPYKADVLAAADALTEAVQRCGAASLLVSREGRLTAHNLDVEAIVGALERRRAAVGRAVVVILGAGGSTAAMLEALRRVPATRVVVLARRVDQAQALVARARTWVPFPVEARPLDAGEDALREATLLVNATPIGVGADDPSPVDRAALRPGMLVYDIVYRRAGLTRLQQDALDAGALVFDGLCHLFEQAPHAFELLTGHPAPREVMLEALVAATGRPPLDWGPESQ